MHTWFCHQHNIEPVLTSATEIGDMIHISLILERAVWFRGERWYIFLFAVNVSDLNDTYYSCYFRIVLLWWDGWLRTIRIESGSSQGRATEVDQYLTQHRDNSTGHSEASQFAVPNKVGSEKRRIEVPKRRRSERSIYVVGFTYH